LHPKGGIFAGANRNADLEVNDSIEMSVIN